MDDPDTLHSPDATRGGLTDVPVDVVVAVGRLRPRIRDLLAFTDGTILPLDRSVDDPVELYVGDRLLARGQLEHTDGAAGPALSVRVTEVVGALSDG